MTEAQWRDLLKGIALEYGLQVSPAEITDVDAFESARSIKLPRSFRSFCLVFGAGDLGGSDHFSIAVPGTRSAEMYSLDSCPTGDGR